MKSLPLQMLWGVLCTLLLFSACVEEDRPAPEPPERTVLLYMAADNNLARFAREDLEEAKLGMARVSSSACLMVYADMGDGNAQLLKLTNEGGTVKEEIVKEYGDRNSTGVAETQEVFNDVFGNPAYQAQSYGLIYWSHCEGWIPYPVPSSRWIGQDTGDGDNRMNLSDFLKVMETAPHFDFVLFDACFMQSIEVAYALRNHTDYYIACPTENPGPGAPYDQIMPYVFQNGASAALADTYFKAYEAIYNDGIGISNDNWTGGVSICVLNTQGLEGLASLTAQLLPASEVDTRALRDEVFNYDQRAVSYEDSAVGYYDWEQMMQRLLDEDDFATWKQAFDASVAYWNTTPMNYSSVEGMFSMEGTNGVTHYIPRSLSSAASEAYRDTEWYEAAGLSQIGW